ncbi:response regulator transcription factor [Pseudohalocynthiibacter aestuariivivens]|uniref:Response regulator transcription factor n=1 Tax=Roseovarius pelagicus TaxID=2980108 RepID=A0ABY6DBU3_9RHOB|nr:MULTISPECIES: response regulator transcription factor [Rhodobacterales]QIE44754.1 response regulator transcription factor [Pseudohalocynthiibacter aestuariivivens]UXX83334.1 response regulator transcription factor [Roseovarius pelagicus]
MTKSTSSVAPARVVIVDDHPMVAEGVEAILQTYDDIDVIATLSDGRQIIEQVEALDPDVILLDLNMPGIGGLSTTEIILERRPETRILILSMHDSPEYISSALSHGAVGYVLKDVPTDEIKHAIDVVMTGQRYLCTGAQGSLTPSGDGAREQLTNREQTILLQLAQGKSNKAVASALDISVRTVETHRANIKRKLGISSTAGLTRYAMEHGVLQGTGVQL